MWDMPAASPEGHVVLESLRKSLYPREMDTQQHHEQARREHILRFWKIHGDIATRDAYGICRRTLYNWQKHPTPQSRAHRYGYQKRVIPQNLTDEINRIRSEHPRLGKEKLTPLLGRFCLQQGLPLPAEPTVGRILTQLKREGRLAAPVRLRMSGKTGNLLEKRSLLQVKKQRRGAYLPTRPGGLLQLDGVLKFIDGKRRYVFTAVDLTSRIGFAMAFPSASSRNGRIFLEHILAIAPFSVSHIQTDNGSEFLKEFRKAAVEADLVHFFNWVKQPKYQGWVERFNRTIQEEFIDWYLHTLAYDLSLFNEKLTVWITWYNTERVHRGLNRKTERGVQKYTPLQYLAVTAECN
jgi:transposase InsO family protein